WHRCPVTDDSWPILLGLFGRPGDDALSNGARHWTVRRAQRHRDRLSDRYVGDRARGIERVLDPGGPAHSNPPLSVRRLLWKGGRLGDRAWPVDDLQRQSARQQ